IAEVFRQAKQAKIEGKSKTILFNLCGHGYLDLGAYEDYLSGKLKDHEISDTEVKKYISELDAYPAIK
ncbi:MAG TPA: hypothetical protein PKK05_20755, partial [Leptospiraceae bacterium]|nr:hypothetical protein [Leptospiraceae bacterium]